MGNSSICTLLLGPWFSTFFLQGPIFEDAWPVPTRTPLGLPVPDPHSPAPLGHACILHSHPAATCPSIYSVLLRLERSGSSRASLALPGRKRRGRDCGPPSLPPPPPGWGVHAASDSLVIAPPAPPSSVSQLPHPCKHGH